MRKRLVTAAWAAACFVFLHVWGPVYLLSVLLMNGRQDAAEECRFWSSLLREFWGLDR